MKSTYYILMVYKSYTDMNTYTHTHIYIYNYLYFKKIKIYNLTSSRNEKVSTTLGHFLGSSGQKDTLFIRIYCFSNKQQ